MKVFTAEQIRKIDQASIENEPIASIDLMERAAMMLFESFVARYDEGCRVMMFVGAGNNGGDALALARLLAQLKNVYDIRVFVLHSEQRSVDNALNLKRLLDELDVDLQTLHGGDFPEIKSDDVVVDALFGTGLSRAVQGVAAELITHINASCAEVFSVDIPSGLFTEDNSSNTGVVVQSDYTVSFQFPKLSFLLSDSKWAIKQWEVVDIDLCSAAIEQMSSPYSFLLDEEAQGAFIERNRFSHKGTFGHALLIAGKKGMMGAAVLAASACIRSGVGLLSSHVPNLSGDILQTTVPEAILSLDRSELMFTDELETSSYDAVGVGPGIGTKPNAQQALHFLLQQLRQPLVVDADALNILALNQEWLNLLPNNTIITPHPKEFDRLTKSHLSAYERLQTQREFAVKWGLVVVLKGAFTSIAMPDGTCVFNSTGNAGMACAGSGDVLTGIITGLLAQGYEPRIAAQLGVWWHGKAADVFAESNNASSLVASDLFRYLAKVDLGY